MSVLTRSPVVVGVDGSDESLVGLAWATHEAHQRHLPLRLVHAWEVPMPGYVPVPASVDLVRESAETVLEQAVLKAQEWAPDTDVESVLMHGATARVLVDQGADAQMIVVGSHGRGGFARLLLGSSSGAVAAHADVPVVVTRGTTATGAWRARPVVVGIDGSAVSESAIAFAFRAAAVRGEGLVVVHAWAQPDPFVDEAYAVLSESATRQTEARLAVSESLAGWRDRYPDVAVTQVIADGHPVDALLAEAADVDAALLVVGSRGRGGFTGLLLGSVSRGVLHHATCPVAVVRPTAHTS
jgi:nucleotide-binding universal stress UspA family protein